MKDDNVVALHAPAQNALFEILKTGVLVNKTGHINLLNSHTESVTNHCSLNETDRRCNT